MSRYPVTIRPVPLHVRQAHFADMRAKIKGAADRIDTNPKGYIEPMFSAAEVAYLFEHIEQLERKGLEDGDEKTEDDQRPETD